MHWNGIRNVQASFIILNFFFKIFLCHIFCETILLNLFISFSHHFHLCNLEIVSNLKTGLLIVWTVWHIAWYQIVLLAVDDLPPFLRHQITMLRLWHRKVSLVLCSSLTPLVLYFHQVWWKLGYEVIESSRGTDWSWWGGQGVVNPTEDNERDAWVIPTHICYKPTTHQGEIRIQGTNHAHKYKETKLSATKHQLQVHLKSGKADIVFVDMQLQKKPGKAMVSSCANVCDSPQFCPKNTWACTGPKEKTTEVSQNKTKTQLSKFKMTANYLFIQERRINSDFLCRSALLTITGNARFVFGCLLAWTGLNGVFCDVGPEKISSRNKLFPVLNSSVLLIFFLSVQCSGEFWHKRWTVKPGPRQVKIFVSKKPCWNVNDFDEIQFFVQSVLVSVSVSTFWLKVHNCFAVTISQRSNVDFLCFASEEVKWQKWAKRQKKDKFHIQRQRKKNQPMGVEVDVCCTVTTTQHCGFEFVTSKSQTNSDLQGTCRGVLEKRSVAMQITLTSQHASTVLIQKEPIKKHFFCHPFKRSVCPSQKSAQKLASFFAVHFGNALKILHLDHRIVARQEWSPCIFYSVLH